MIECFIFIVSMQVTSDQSISLSNSVAVTVHTRNTLQLTHQLEDTYRARYKSDYFPQKGEPRRPRYVADNKGNHCVTLQVQMKVFEIQINSFHF